MIDVAPPPPRWDFPYAGPGIELRLPRAKVNVICRVLGVDIEPGRPVWGCAVWGDGGCLMIIPRVDEVVAADDQARVRAHEGAHCNGMGPDHR